MNDKITLVLSNGNLIRLNPIFNESDIDSTLDTLRQQLPDLLDKQIAQTVYNQKYGLSADDLVQDFNGDMLYLAMCIRDVYNEDICDKIGIEDDDIEQLDLGIVKPSRQQLERLVVELGFRTGHFTREGKIDREGKSIFACKMPAWAG